MKLSAFLFSLLLLTPGSGQLIFDGIPLSTRVEFLALIALCLVLSSSTARARIRATFESRLLREALGPALGFLILLKFLTFTWLPYSDGFSACYRSLYRPLPIAETCERSYEGPFLHGGFVIDNLSRTEHSVDVGKHLHDWSLPFMNEYPRLGALWLERFPFTAQFGAALRTEASSENLLPIYGNGEISGRVNTESFSTEAVPLVDRYEFPRLSIIRVPTGLSEFELNYRFTEDDTSQPPDEKPPVRGPYAMLKIGDLQTRESLLEFAQIRVRGWTIDISRQRTPDYVIAIDQAGKEVGRSEAQERPDVAAYVGIPNLTSNGFNFAIPARALSSGDVKIQAVYSDKTSVIGILTTSASYVPELPVVQILPLDGQRGDFQVWFDADRSDFTAMAPEYQERIGIGLRALLLLVDGSSMVIFAGIFLALLMAIRTSLPVAGVLGVASLVSVLFGTEIAPEILGSPLFLPLAVVSGLVVFAARRYPSNQLMTYLPVAVVLGAYKSFDHLQRFHASKGERWWGRLLFYWRDSDWFATQGFARSVFLEGSLRGGESVFWFQAGPRYLALFTRVLLGENDALVGIVMTAVGFFAVFALYFSFQKLVHGLPMIFAGGVGLFILLFFMADDLMASFGFLGSSEYPTWAALLFITGFIVTTSREARSWLMVSMAIVLGYSIQLRPNQIGGVVLLFIALVLLIDRRDSTRAIATASKMALAFLAIVLFSLLHNLYYGESFVPFTANAGINYQFSWLDVLGIEDGDATWVAVWDQLRVMMYWNSVDNWSWALMFWGSQLLWLGVVAYRLRIGLALRVRSLLLVIPFGYALPMLKYQMGSYYPRHLVVINLAFMCAALMAWPRDNEMFGGDNGSDAVGETTESSSTSVAVNAAVS